MPSRDKLFLVTAGRFAALAAALPRQRRSITVTMSDGLVHGASRRGPAASPSRTSSRSPAAELGAGCRLEPAAAAIAKLFQSAPAAAVAFLVSLGGPSAHPSPTRMDRESGSNGPRVSRPQRSEAVVSLWFLRTQNDGRRRQLELDQPVTEVRL
jgi:hypothetical protein